jgi:hypothetical protein
MSHTKGRLVYDGEGRIDALDYRKPTEYVCDDGTPYMGGLVALIYTCGDGTRDANGLRLVACWNACDGIATEALESGEARVVRDELARIETLLRQRDELLASLNGLVEAGDACVDPSNLSGGDIEAMTLFAGADRAARDAIAKATGEAK